MGRERESAYLDIKEIFGQNWRTVVDWSTLTVELTAEHLSGDGHSEDISCEFTMSI